MNFKRNYIYHSDAQSMLEIPDKTVKLMVTSPPYNVTKEYDENLSLKEYLTLLKNVLTEVYRVLTDNGICAINIANVGRKPYLPLDCYVIQILYDIGFTIKQEIIWNKAASAGTSCAWGSWKSASNPSLRDIHEYIILASKMNTLKPKLLKKTNFSIEVESKSIKFSGSELYQNIWNFGTESARRVNHPAPFRVELPYRIIQLFTNVDDIVLDPFMGSGSTAIASLVSKRQYIGYEINHEYVELANKRIDEFLKQNKKKKAKKTLDVFITT
ncbi:DNA-methyltransferase [Candidatus Harpocratesius sp.]